MAMRQLPVLGGHSDQPFSTMRSDAWWVGPALTLSVLSGFLIYATWAMLQGGHYYVAPYLSPLYEPLIWIKSGGEGVAPVEHAWLGEWPGWMPALVPASPAFLILPFPGLFRFTCYYYRKAYYRAFAGSPPACAVGPALQTREYRGETAFLVFQNLHRYALYFALAFNVFLFEGAIRSFFRNGEFGVGVGSIVLLTNATLLAGYSFGCHSFRHLIGGHDDCMSCGQNTLKYGTWKRATWFNVRHMQFAWTSLFSVALTDVYVRLVSMGIIHDFNTWS
jgi:hypothetical protein